MKLSDYRKQTSEKVNENVFKKSFKKMVSMYKGFKTKMDFAVNTVKKTYQTNLQEEMKKRGLVMTPKSLDEQFKEKYGNVIYRNIDRDNPVFQNKVKMLSHVQKETGKEMMKAEEKQEDFTRQLSTSRKRFGDPDSPEEKLRKEQEKEEYDRKVANGEIEPVQTRTVNLNGPRKRFGDPDSPEDILRKQQEKEEYDRKVANGEIEPVQTRTVSEMTEEKWLKRAQWLGFETTEQFRQWQKDLEAEKKEAERRREEARDMWS